MKNPKLKKIIKVLTICFSLASTICLALSIYTNVVLSSLDKQLTEKKSELNDLSKNEEELTEKVNQTQTDEFIDSYKRQVLGYGVVGEKKIEEK